MRPPDHSSSRGTPRARGWILQMGRWFRGLMSGGQGADGLTWLAVDRWLRQQAGLLNAEGRGVSKVEPPHPSVSGSMGDTASKSAVAASKACTSAVEGVLSAAA